MLGKVINKVQYIWNCWKEKKYYGSGNEKRVRELQNSLTKKQCNTLLITIAFNNEQVIGTQIKQVEKYCQDKEYVHLIMDNSGDEKVKRKIENVVKENQSEKIIYFSMPKSNPYSGKAPSSSHGAALNWCWYNVINQVNNLRYVMFLDHDIFPTRNFSVKNLLNNQTVYGLKDARDKFWYLWPGYCMFNVACLKNKKVNFMPGKYGDTGAMNYPIIYQKCCVEKMKFATEKMICINENIEQTNQILQRDNVQVIDETWLHMINASNWFKLENVEEKYKKVVNLLKKT